MKNKSAIITGSTSGIGFSLAQHLAKEGCNVMLTCNAICPGYVKTPLVEGQIKDQAKSRGISEKDVVHDVILESQPTKKFVGLDEVGALTVFLAGDGAASITGTAISIDGGWTAQ